MKKAIRLSLRLYLDECAYSKRLVSLLHANEHYVETPTDSNLFGRPDGDDFAYARSRRRHSRRG